MDTLEYEIRKRLGQKNFEPINNRKHKRFDFSHNNRRNRKIIELFDDFEFQMPNKYGTDIGRLFEVFELTFSKGSCLLIYEEMDIDIERFDCTYRNIIVKEYTGLGTVEIIKDIILNYSTNYKEVIRDISINKILLNI
jgi:hypothetical protein